MTTHAAGSGQSRRVGSPFRWLKANQATVGTLLYVWVSVIGSIYQWTLAGRFGINVFDFARPTDFLLAAFRQPFSIGQAIFALIAVAVLVPLLNKVELHSAQLTGLWRFLYRAVYNPYTILTVGIAYTLFIPWLVARQDASDLIDGWGTYVHVELVLPAEAPPSFSDTATMLVGTTSEYLFLYRRDTGQSHVLPITTLRHLRLCDGSRSVWGKLRRGGMFPQKGPPTRCAP